MWNTHSHRRPAGWVALACLLLACVSGCGWIQNVRRNIEGGVSIKTAGDRETWQKFQRTVYADRGEGLVTIVMTDESHSADPSVGLLTQTLVVRMLWRHQPGISRVDAASTNSLVRYRIETSHGWREYRGAGVVTTRSTLGGALRVELSGVTVRTHATGGDVPDVYGVARLAGRFVATSDAEAVAAVVGGMKRLPTSPSPSAS